MKHPLALGAVATTAAMIAAGCGGSSSSSTNTAAPAAASNAAQTQQGSAYARATTTSTTAAPTSSAGTVITTKQSKLGTILAAGPKQMTVYLFEGDKGAASACSGPCTGVWPPVTTSAHATSAGGAMAADLGTLTRSDGSKQVTYKGHPLYFFARDGDKGDAYGQGVNGFGASWYVLAPSGSKVDKS